MIPQQMRILTIAQNVPGPVAVARLWAEGATILKVEPPQGDPLERLSRSWYDELHSGVRIERLDLKSTGGASALRSRLTTTDVFVASHRPGALARLGLDADSLRRDFPALRHLNIVGEVAHPDDPGHDLTYQARAGLLQGGLPATLLADMIGAEHAYTAVRELMLDAPGSRRVVGLMDGLAAFAAPVRHGLTTPGGPLGGGDPAYAVYPTREGLVAVAALEKHFRARLYEALGLPDGSDLSTSMRIRTAVEWEAWGTEQDIPIAAVWSCSSTEPE